MLDYEAYVERIDELVVDQPFRVVAAFLVVTLVFGAGLAGISTDAGTSQFTEDSEAQAALEDVNRQFEPAFEGDTGSTQLIQTHSNVLSKPALLDVLETLHRIQQREGLRVTETNSVAGAVARRLDPSADGLPEQIDAVETATPGEVRVAAEAASASPGVRALLSDDFNAQDPSASVTLVTVTHRVSGLSSSTGTSGTSPLTDIQLEVQRIANAADTDIRTFGSGIISAELGNVIADSLLIVTPAAILLILIFLVFAYRDPIDLLIGVVSLALAVVWTFGFMGLTGIPFSQMLIAVPPLLLAVGIDFGIHIVNRYREERAEGVDPRPSMRATIRQLLVAFFIVTGTTVLGFSANLISDLGPIRDFGLVAAVGIVFTFLIFGIFLPATKVIADRLRERYSLPEFGSTPVGSEGSALGAALGVGVSVARRTPKLFLVVMLVATAGAGAYGAGVDTSFETEDFLPPEEQPAWLQELPEPFAPGTYTVTRDLNYLEDNFESTEGSSVTVYVEGNMRRDSVLESMARAAEEPPDAFVTRDRAATGTSIVTIIQGYADRDPEFARLVERNDANANGIPDDNLERIYDYLLASPAGDRASRYITEDYSSARVEFTVKADASQDEVVADARELTADYRTEATATGQTVVFKDISDIIFSSAVQSLALALVATGLFLVFIYQVLEGRWGLGVVNLVPIVVTLAFLAAGMRYLSIPLNALTATILSIAIGLGIDYSAHVVHRFVDEYESGADVFTALDDTVRGTGGALLGSMLTTATGMGVLALAITPVLGQFGVVTALSIGLSFLTSIVVTPSAVVVWDEVVA
jgi:predicted RND superfamily exporter protein